VDNLSRDLLIQMWEAGYITLFMGVESADQQVLDQVDKKTTISKIKDAFEIARKEKNAYHCFSGAGHAWKH